MSTRRVLAADIGGTKTLFHIAEVSAQGRRILYEQRYESQLYDDFTSLTRHFLKEAGGNAGHIHSACLGLAGPVASDEGGQTASVTNLPWRLESRELASALGIPRILLINDFQAIGYGIEALTADDLVILQHGRQRGGAPRLIIGAGTGLGVSQMIWQEDRYEIMASEGGHVDFAPTDARQTALLHHLMSRFGHVSCERVLSGPGLANIYQFLRDDAPAMESKALRQAISESDPAAAITAFANQGDALADEALDIFVSIYGAQAGNLALFGLSFGGVYVAGGIAPKIIDRLNNGRFIAAFNDKGRMSPLLSSIPVYVITNTRVGLLGAAQAAYRL